MSGHQELFDQGLVDHRDQCMELGKEATESLKMLLEVVKMTEAFDQYFFYSLLRCLLSVTLHNAGKRWEVETYHCLFFLDQPL
jgi:hypothetical protein